MSIAISTIRRSAPLPERSIAMAVSTQSAWIADAPLSAAIFAAAASWPLRVPMVSSLMPCLFAFVPFRGVKERTLDRNSRVDMGGASRTSPCCARRRYDGKHHGGGLARRWLGKFCRADDLDLVNGAKNRGSHRWRPYRIPKPRRALSLHGTMAETSKMGYDATYSTASYPGIHGGKEANCRTRGVRPGSKGMVDGIERPVRAQRLCIEPGRVPHDIARHGPGPDRVERTIMD